jgi:hypothetical protein
VVEGSPREEIIRYARTQEIDLIVLATHGRSGLAHVITGRQQARAALAALPPAGRAFRQALHAEHFPAPPGGPAYRLEDLLFHLIDGSRYGYCDERLALALAVPVAYLRVVVGDSGPQGWRVARGSLVAPRPCCTWAPAPG